MHLMDQRAFTCLKTDQGPSKQTTHEKHMETVKKSHLKKKEKSPNS